MALGESLYNWGFDHNDPTTVANAVKETIPDIISGEHSNKQWTKLSYAFLGLSGSRYNHTDQINRFWDSVLFYDYIQEVVGSECRQAPLESMWRDAGPAFTEVLDSYKPKVIICFGSRLWQKMLEGREGKDLTIGEDSRSTRMYDYCGGCARATWVKHFSTGHNPKTDSFVWVKNVIDSEGGTTEIA